VGVRHALFPNTGIRRLVGCRLPDAILLASEVFGLIAGPSSALWSLKY
jgi:hypothetical protein